MFLYFLCAVATLLSLAPHKTLFCLTHHAEKTVRLQQTSSYIKRAAARTASRLPVLLGAVNAIACIAQTWQDVGMIVKAAIKRTGVKMQALIKIKRCFYTLGFRH